MDSVAGFINYLSQIPVPDGRKATNLYLGDDELSEIRRENLRIYLNRMISLNPSILIIGEAAGYNGCRLTGIPFTSEFIIKRGVPEIFELSDGYQFKEGTTYQRETSATIVWEELIELRKSNHDLPLIWNIYPFHPYKTHEKTNRTPARDEIDTGIEILHQLLSLFSITKIGAIGKKSYNAIKDKYPNVLYIRHPANRGKGGFMSGIKELFIPQIHHS